MSITLVNPCNEQKPAASRAPRLTTLAGKTIALLDISKPGGNVFLDRLEKLLVAHCSVARVVREIKPTYTKPAPEPLLEKLRSVDAVIEGLAD
jgi:hypothetical protein